MPFGAVKADNARASAGLRQLSDAADDRRRPVTGKPVIVIVVAIASTAVGVEVERAAVRM
jgi:hypothetical protein